MDSLEASAKEEVGEDCFSVGGAKNENLMDWELSEEEAGEVTHPPLIAPKIVSEVPMEEAGVYRDELDVESFSFDSFESEDEEESVGEDQPETKPMSELSTVFDLKVLQTVIEASAEALDLVVGKDVVMVTGKTGMIFLPHFLLNFF